MTLYKRTLAQTLRDARLSKKLTLGEVSKETRLSVSYLSELERGEKGNPSAIILFKISKGYGVPLEELMSLLNNSGEKVSI